MKNVKVSADKVLEFARVYGRPTCFGGWPDEAIHSYLHHHAGQGTVVVLAKGVKRRIMGLAVGWQDQEEHLRRPGFERMPFVYQNTDPEGDSFYIADVILAGTRAERAVRWGYLVGEFQWRFPNWRSLKLFGLRHGRLVQWNPENLFAKLEGLSK